jgi:chemotaxis protein MotB
MSRRKRGGHGGGGGHDAGGSMRWLLTYADMITLLVAFFVMLYALSILDLKKFQAVAGALRMNFGGEEKTMPEGGTGVLMPGPSADAAPAVISGAGIHHLSAIAGKLREMVRAEGLRGLIQVIEQERGVIIRIASDGILFDMGSSELKAEALPLLQQTAKLLREGDLQVRVEGHTCDLPIRSARFPSNWELSAARAAAVVRFLTTTGIPAKRLAAVGYADSQPLLAFTSDENRRRNRRVDIVLLKDERQRLLDQILEGNGR